MTFTFDAKGYSTSGLQMMHEGIHKAHKHDRETEEGHDKLYGVYEYKDWKIQSDEIESELRSRNVEIDSVPWGDHDPKKRE